MWPFYKKEEDFLSSYRKTVSNWNKEAIRKQQAISTEAFKNKKNIDLEIQHTEISDDSLEDYPIKVGASLKEIPKETINNHIQTGLSTFSNNYFYFNYINPNNFGKTEIHGDVGISITINLNMYDIDTLEIDRENQKLIIKRKNQEEINLNGN